MKATGTYSVKKWEENPWENISSEMKMTKASIEYSMSGEINGKAIAEYLMFYNYVDAKDQHKSSAMYIALMRFVGSVRDKEGSFVIEDHGSFENGAARSILRIIDASGTGELKAITGTGLYRADKDGIHIEFDYSL